MIRATVDDALTERLVAAYRASGLSLEEMIEQSGLDMSPPSMHRKLHGDQSMDTEECKAIAGVLGFRLDWTGSKFVLRKAA